MIPGLGRSPGEGKGYPLWHSGLENSMDCIVQGVAKSQTRLSEFHFHFHFHSVIYSPLDSKEIKSLNPKGNQPEYSLEGLMLQLKLQYFGHLM